MTFSQIIDDVMQELGQYEKYTAEICVHPTISKEVALDSRFEHMYDDNVKVSKNNPSIKYPNQVRLEAVVNGYPLLKLYELTA